MSASQLSKEELRAARLRNLGIIQSPSQQSEPAQIPSTSPPRPIATATSIYSSVSSPNVYGSQQETVHVTRAVSMDQFDGWCAVLYRNSGFVTADDMNRWCSEGFRFCQQPNFGLVQGHGGPCGVLAAVQAEVFRALFFDADGSSSLSDTSSLPSFVEPVRVSAALIKAFYTILLRGVDGAGEVKLITLKEDLSPFEVAQFSTWQHTFLHVTSFPTEESFTAALSNPQLGFGRNFESNAGCLLLLMSAIVTRGLEAVSGDMASDPSSSFIGQFGHCNQETLNLLLAGRATSLVLDGTQTLDAELSLCGIPQQTDIGYLSALEAARYVTVGRYLKRPKFPLWVLGGTSHFTVLLSLDPRVNAESSAELLLEILRRAFKAEDPDGAGFVPSSALRAVLERVQSEMNNNILANILQRHNQEDSTELARLRGLCQVDGEIVLWQGFWTHCSQLLAGRLTLDELTANISQVNTGAGNGNDEIVDLSMVMDADEENIGNVTGKRPRSDSDYARMLQAEFDQAPNSDQNNQNVTTLTNTGNHSSNTNSNSSSTSSLGLGGLDFSALLGLSTVNTTPGYQPMQTPTPAIPPVLSAVQNHTNNNNHNNNYSNGEDIVDTRPRSDSEVARALQAEFDFELDEQANALPPPLVVDPTPANQMFVPNNSTNNNNNNGTTNTSVMDVDDLQNTYDTGETNDLTQTQTQTRMNDSVANETDDRFLLWHFNGLHGGQLRQVSLFRRSLGDCIGQVVSLETADALALSDGRAFEDLLRTRWPGCSLRWEGAEPKIE